MQTIIEQEEKEKEENSGGALSQSGRIRFTLQEKENDMSNIG